VATSLRPLRTALYAKLTAVPALAGRVSAKPLENGPFPYVQLGTITEFPDDMHSAQGLEASVVIHVWDKEAESDAGVFDLYAAVDAALDRQPLTITGFSEVRIKHAQHQTIDDPDPDVRHINAQYEVHMTKE
jgi:hypothetical protein